MWSNVESEIVITWSILMTSFWIAFSLRYCGKLTLMPMKSTDILLAIGCISESPPIGSCSHYSSYF